MTDTAIVSGETATDSNERRTHDSRSSSGAIPADLPEYVRRVLEGEGVTYHGAFKVVGDGDEAARLIAAKRRIPDDRLNILISIGPEYSTDRVDYLLSEPDAKVKTRGNKNEVASASYEPTKRSAA